VLLGDLADVRLVEDERALTADATTADPAERPQPTRGDPTRQGASVDVEDQARFLAADQAGLIWHTQTIAHSTMGVQEPEHRLLRHGRTPCNARCMSEPATSGMAPEWDLADRMRKALRVADIGVQEMATYLGVARNTVSTWINGRIAPSTQTLRLWSMRTGVSYEWLVADGGDSGLPRKDSNLQPAGNGTLAELFDWSVPSWHDFDLALAA
jgi:transcriptional regulator with XRE-family HTH domain